MSRVPRALLLLATVAASSGVRAQGSPFAPPELLDDAPAPYPEALRASPVAGDVELELTIDETGEVERAEVVGRLHPLLDDAALHAATRLRFRPARQEELPVAARVRFRYRFALPGSAPPSAPPVAAAEQPPARGAVRGTVRQMGTRRPLASVGVRTADGTATETDVDGRFTLDLPPGPHRLALQLPGHLPRTFEESVRRDEAVEVTYWLHPEQSRPYETVVQGERDREEATRITLRDAELRDTPGTLGDPFRVVMLLPGVGSLVSGISYPVVRGSQPAATGFFLDGIRVPILFHLFLGPAVIHPDFIDGLDFYPGAPPASYGRLLAGAVEGHLTRPREKGVHGSVYADLLNAGAFLEFPIAATGTSVSLAGRYSYSGLLLGLFNVSGTRPVLSFADYQGRIEQKVGAGTLRLFAFGSFDEVGVVGTLPGLPSFLQEITFHRIDLRYQLPVGTGTFEVAGTAGWENLGARAVNEDEQALSLSVADRTLGIRSTFSQRLVPTLDLKVGADYQHRVARLSGTTNTGGLIDLPSQSIDAPVATGYVTGTFAQLTWQPQKAWRIVPGLRLDTYHYIPGIHRVAFEPRLAVRWDVAPTVTLKAGGGLYHMAPAALITLPVQDIAGLRLGLQQSAQVTAGVEWKIVPGLEVAVEGYFNPMRRVVELDPASALLNALGSAVPEAVARNLQDIATRGRSYGAEILLRHPLGDRWFGWLSYSFNRSERRDRFARFDDFGDVYAIDSAWLPYAFEQQHVLNATVSYQVGAGWTLGATLHFHTGRPESGLFTSRTRRPGFVRDAEDPSVASPAWVLQDLDRADRLPPFFRADIRVSKTWTLETFTLEAYLDWQNVAFRPEVLGFTYDEAPTASGTSLLKTPIGLILPLPLLGVKARF